MNKQLQKFAFFLNKIPGWFWVWLILCANFLSFIPHSNEEHYFAAAKQFYNPNWLPYSFAFNEWAGTRFLFQYIVGFCLEFISFEQMTFWGRLVNFLLFSFPLAKIFSRFKLNNIFILLILQVLFIPFQTFFGGEWIFKAFEVKTLAYIFIFHSILALLNKQTGKSILYSIVATYFHILVGGWFAIATFTYLILNNNTYKSLFLNTAIYSLAISPLMLYLAANILGGASEINGVNLDWIYTYYRAPHHCAPFSSYSLFKYEFLFGILLSISSVIVAMILKKGNISEQQKSKLNLLIASLFILLTGIIISSLDTNGKLLKLYPFRIGSIAMFLFIVSIVVYCRDLIPTKKLENLTVILLVLISPFLIRATWETADKLRTNYDYYNSILAKWAISNTEKDDIFFFVDIRDDQCLTFPRKSERSRYIIEKAIPAGGDKVYEWYRRVEFKKGIGENLEVILDEKKNNKIDYLVFKKKELEKSWLKKVYENDIYSVFQITN